MHLFLSPHADDAALSCGAQIATLARSGERVIIFTIMAGDPPVGFTPTNLTRALHARWKLDDNTATEARRHEDLEAGKVLGAEVKFGPYPDCIYRVDPKTHAPLYLSDEAVFKAVHPNDPLKEAKRAAVIQAIFSVFNLKSTDTIHVPLAVGKHVDHQLVRDMGKAIAQWHPNNRLYFYDDYPYALQGLHVIRQAVTELELDVTRTLRQVDDSAIDTKIKAVSCYQSQISSFWDSTGHMEREIRAFVKQVGGEGEWRLIAS